MCVCLYIRSVFISFFILFDSVNNVGNVENIWYQMLSLSFKSLNLKKNCQFWGKFSSFFFFFGENNPFERSARKSKLSIAFTGDGSSTFGRRRRLKKLKKENPLFGVSPLTDLVLKIPHLDLIRCESQTLFFDCCD